MPPGKTAKTKNGNGGTLGIENELWEAADKLRGHLDAAEGVWVRLAGGLDRR